MALGLLAGTGPVWAQSMVPPMPDPRGGETVVWESLPNQSGGPGSDTAFLTEFGTPVWQRLADNFVLTGSGSTIPITRVTWWGFYQQTFAPDAQTMRIRIYDNRPNDLPGQVVFEESFNTPQFFWTGLLVGGLSPNALEYEFTRQLSLPFDAQVGQKYWLEVVQIGDLNSHFRWEDSSFGDDYVFLNLNIVDWAYSGSVVNRSFRLSTIPEPGTVSLLAMAAGLALASERVSQRRRRRWTRAASAHKAHMPASICAQHEENWHEL